MADIKQSREAGRRRAARHGGKSLMAPTLGVHTSELGEHRLNIKQVYALDAMYCTHPAVQAARTVLHSQLLSGGLKLVRDGETLKEVKFGEKDETGQNKKGITKHFNQHLEEHWLPFAKEVVDCFIKWGICPVVFDVLEEHPCGRGDPPAQERGGRRRKRQAQAEASRRRPSSIPHVPTLGAWLGWS